MRECKTRSVTTRRKEGEESEREEREREARRKRDVRNKGYDVRRRVEAKGRDTVV